VDTTSITNARRAWSPEHDPVGLVARLARTPTAIDVHHLNVRQRRSVATTELPHDRAAQSAPRIFVALGPLSVTPGCARVHVAVECQRKSRVGTKGVDHTIGWR
jgi:hypothetical protein